MRKKNTRNFPNYIQTSPQLALVGSDSCVQECFNIGARSDR